MASGSIPYLGTNTMSYDVVVVYQGGKHDGATELQSGPLKLRAGYRSHVHVPRRAAEKEVEVVVVQWVPPVQQYTYL